MFDPSGFGTANVIAAAAAYTTALARTTLCCRGTSATNVAHTATVHSNGGHSKPNVPPCGYSNATTSTGASAAAASPPHDRRRCGSTIAHAVKMTARNALATGLASPVAIAARTAGIGRRTRAAMRASRPKVMPRANGRRPMATFVSVPVANHSDAHTLRRPVAITIRRSTTNAERAALTTATVQIPTSALSTANAKP